MKIGLLLIISHALAFADVSKPGFQVEVDPKIYSSSEFERKGVVRSGNIPPRTKRPDALPDSREREAAFARVPGLGPSLAGMDGLSRDLLFVRAKTRPLKELEKLYPKIDAKKLSRLKNECAKMNR